MRDFDWIIRGWKFTVSHDYFLLMSLIRADKSQINNLQKNEK